MIEWIRKRAPRTGDDCAVLPCEPWGQLLVTVDSVIDGVHARWREDGPRAFGYKVVARGLSHVAAMAGEPLWVVLAATLPPGTPAELAREVVLGAEDAGVELVGGDTATGPVASLSATVLGRAAAPVLRSGARAGDVVVVSGPLGNAHGSGWHLRFRPRVEEARALAAACDVGAMIDVSDGLSTDLFAIVEASGVGARLDSDRIPLRDGATLEGALGDGEDYEILATIRPGEKPPRPFVPIGEILESGVYLDEQPLVRAGYEH